MATPNKLNDVVKTITEKTKKPDTLDYTDPQVLGRMAVSTNMMGALGMNKKSDDPDSNNTTQNIYATIERMMASRQLDKLIASLNKTDSDEQPQKNSEIDALKNKIEKMEEDAKRREEEQKRKEELAALMAPIMSRLDNIERSYTNGKEDKEKNTIQAELSSIKEQFGNVVTKIEKRDKDQQMQDLIDRVSEVEGGVQQQYAALMNTLREGKSPGKSTDNNDSLKAAYKRLKEEKELLKELGLIKENLESGKDQDNVLETLNETLKRAPEIVESTKTIYDMIKGTDSSEDDEIPPYENESLEQSTPPTLERKPVALPPDLQAYLDSGRIVNDPANPDRKIWTDKWSSAYNSTDGVYLQKDEVETQMKLYPDSFRADMKQSEARYKNLNATSKQTTAHPSPEPAATEEPSDANDETDEPEEDE